MKEWRWGEFDDRSLLPQIRSRDREIAPTKTRYESCYYNPNYLSSMGNTLNCNDHDDSHPLVFLL